MSASLTLLPTPLAGLSAIQRVQRGDERGYLERLFCADDLSPLLGDRRVLQVNRTLTARTGTVRGLHYQKSPRAECKLVSCLRGSVFDVAVDLRTSSATFLQWHAELLSAANLRGLWIPEGFAHGFQALEPDCELLYLHTAAYSPGFESGLNVRDSRLGISWPLPIELLSARDDALPMLGNDFEGLEP
jgi:dTDP-4-dehydrorhamnose 3,5-epimerase